MDIARRLRTRIASALKGWGYRKVSGSWIRPINQDICLIAELHIVNNPAGKFVSAQISVGSESLQLLHDPNNSIGMRLSYLTVSTAEMLCREGHLTYPSSEEESDTLATTIIGTLASINERLEAISDGGQALKYMKEHPAYCMVGPDVIAYLNDLTAGKITHEDYPNWQAYAATRG